jgi:hypothetical protein
MNQGTISGVIVGEFKEIGSGDFKGVRFPVEVAINPKKPDEKEIYQVVAFAANAEMLKKDAKAGYRLNAEHRLGSDKVADKQYDSVLTVSKVSGIMEDPTKGMDSVTVVIGGTGKFRKLNTTPNGAPVLNATVVITKEFQGKVSTLHADVALWNSLGVDNADRADTEVDVVVAGTPRPKLVKGKEGAPDQLKMDVWANSVMFVSGGESAPADTSEGEEEAPKTEAPKRQFRTQKEEKIEF